MGHRNKQWVACVIVATAVMLGACDARSDTPSTTTSTVVAPPAQPTTTTAASAPELLSDDIGELIGSYFTSDRTDLTLQNDLATEIAEHATTGELAELLHRHVDFPIVGSGRTTIAAPIGFNQARQIVVRTPAGYDPTQPWPLIVLYHGWGGEADLRIDRMEQFLGAAIDEYVVAAPDDYRQTVIDAPPPVSAEHVSMWRAVRQRWHVDSDRTYLAGYSLGGDTVVTLASMHPGYIAGGLALASGAAYPTDVEGLVERFIPQLAGIEMLQVYGADDASNIPGLNGRKQAITNAEQAQLMERIAAEFGMDRYRVIGLEGVGHSGVYPAVEEALVPLTAERSPLPTEFTHSFRYIHQADAYWVEGHEWSGDAWLTPWPETEALPGETDNAALDRTIHALLGRIDASIDGQTLVVDTDHLADYTIWFHEGMIDWSEPVTVVANDATVFNGLVTPSVDVALSQAARVYDFDRLRLAGIRVNPVDGTAKLVTGEDEFPDIARGITF